MKLLHLPAPLVEQLGWVLVHSVWQLTLVAVAALLLARAMRRSTARSRYAMLVVALTAMTLAPIATLLVLPEPRPTIAVTDMTDDSRVTVGSPWVRDDLGPPANRPTMAAPAAERLPNAGDEAAIAMGAEASEASPPAGESAGVWGWAGAWGWIASVWADVELAVQAWLEWIVALWCLGVFVFAWRPAVSWYEVGRLRRVGVSPAADRVSLALCDIARRMRLSRGVRIFESTRVRVPVVVGYLRPMILLPVSLVSQLTLPQLEAILAHELAHIRRHDYLVNLWQTLVETALFYHPAVWWLSHRIRVERENCCDDIAVAVVENRVEYGRALLALEELRGKHTALALGARSGSLLARVGRLFPGERGEGRFESGNLAALGLLVASLLSLVVWTTAVAKDADERGDPNASYADAVSDRFAAALAKQKLPFVTPEALGALRTELHDYLAERAKSPPAGAGRTAVLKALDVYVPNEFAGRDAYLNFRSSFNVLKWRLWTAAERRELSPEEIEQRETQRQWMRAFISSLDVQPAAPRHWGREATLQALESGAFGDPLCPFFHDPMTPDEFETFKDKASHYAMLPGTAFGMFFSAAQVRIESLEKRWPPGFPVTGHVTGSANGDVWRFSMCPNVFIRDFAVNLEDSLNGPRVYFDVASNRPIHQNGPRDENATELWLAKNQQGDIRFDPETKQLIAVRGARLATLDATEWYAIDRISTADLRRRVAKAPLMTSYSLATLPSTERGRGMAAQNAAQKLPTLVLETGKGQIALLRVGYYDGDPAHVHVRLHVRGRPLPPYPPFSPGDPEYTVNGDSGAAAAQPHSATTSQLAAADASGADANDQAPAAERVLHFPADRTMGIVYQRESNEKGYVYGVYVEEWKTVGEARGEVRVPAGKEVRLDLSKAASADLSGLDGLGPDDLDVLNCRRTDVTDEGLAHVGRLTGLLILDLESNRITDAGMKNLSGLTKLRFVELGAFHVNREGFGVGDETLKVLAGLPALETIRLRDTKVTGAGLAALAALKSLGHLNLSGTRIGDAGLANLKQLPSLVSLGLGVYNTGADITDEGLKTIGEIVNLKSLDLAGNKITDAGLIHLRNLTRLENLGLDNTGITEAGLANLEPLQALEDLRLYTGHRVTDVGAAHLAKLKSLRRLTDNLTVTDVGVALLASLPRLETLSLSDSTITIDGARQIAGMKSLKRLGFGGCPIGDEELAAMCDLPNLEWLQLSHTHVSGDGLKYLAGMPKLSILSIDFGDRNDQPEGLKPNLRAVVLLSQLKDLRVRGWGLDGNDLENIAWMLNLEELELDFPVDDQGALQIAALRHLKHLKIRNSVLTDVGMKYLSNLRELTFLDLSGHFSDRGLESLAKLKSLWGLQIRSPYITKDGVQALERQLPALQYCNVWGDPAQERIVTGDKDTIRRYGDAEERAAKDALEDKPPPPLRLTGWVNTEPDGLDLDKLHGKVVLVDFWGTWCGPCRALTPKLKALDEKYRDQGLVILGVHTLSEAAKMPEYVAEHKIGWPTAVDVEQSTAQAWKVTGYPTLYLIDRWGNLRFAGIYRDDAEGAVIELIGEKAPPQPAVDSGAKP